MSGDVVAFPARPGAQVPPTREPGSSGFPQSPSLLFAQAIFYALTPDQKVRARSFLTLRDPMREDPATQLVERVMRRVRQVS